MFHALALCSDKAPVSLETIPIINLEIALALPKPKTNFLNHSFVYSNVIPWKTSPFQEEKAKKIH